jgi:hypothetical protein
MTGTLEKPDSKRVDSTDFGLSSSKNGRSEIRLISSQMSKDGRIGPSKTDRLIVIGTLTLHSTWM